MRTRGRIYGPNPDADASIMSPEIEMADIKPVKLGQEHSPGKTSQPNNNPIMSSSETAEVEMTNYGPTKRGTKRGATKAFEDIAAPRKSPRSSKRATFPIQTAAAPADKASDFAETSKENVAPSQLVTSTYTTNTQAPSVEPSVARPTTSSTGNKNKLSKEGYIGSAAGHVSANTLFALSTATNRSSKLNATKQQAQKELRRLTHMSRRARQAASKDVKNSDVRDFQYQSAAHKAEERKILLCVADNLGIEMATSSTETQGWSQAKLEGEAQGAEIVPFKERMQGQPFAIASLLALGRKKHEMKVTKANEAALDGPNVNHEQSTSGLNGAAFEAQATIEAALNGLNVIDGKSTSVRNELALRAQVNNEAPTEGSKVRDEKGASVVNGSAFSPQATGEAETKGQKVNFGKGTSILKGKTNGAPATKPALGKRVYFNLSSDSADATQTKTYLSKKRKHEDISKDESAIPDSDVEEPERALGTPSNTANQNEQQPSRFRRALDRVTPRCFKRKPSTPEASNTHATKRSKVHHAVPTYFNAPFFGFRIGITWPSITLERNNATPPASDSKTEPAAPSANFRTNLNPFNMPSELRHQILLLTSTERDLALRMRHLSEHTSNTTAGDPARSARQKAIARESAKLARAKEEVAVKKRQIARLLIDLQEVEERVQLQEAAVVKERRDAKRAEGAWEGGEDKRKRGLVDLQKKKVEDKSGVLRYETC